MLAHAADWKSPGLTDGVGVNEDAAFASREAAGQPNDEAVLLSLHASEHGGQPNTLCPMEVLAQSPWNWTLVADGDDLVFDAEILAQGPMSGQYYSVTIVLSSEEAGAYAERGTAALDELAEQMNRSTKRYLPRKRLGLSAQIGEACVRWRAERSAGPEADA